MDRTTLNSIGLVLDIIGALMLWRFVAEIAFADRDEFLKGHGQLRVFDPTPEQIGAFKRNMLFSRIGIGLLVVGFLFQLLSNYVR